MLKISEDAWKYWKQCCLAYDKKSFKEKYPDLYPYINSMSNKRKILKYEVEAMSHYGGSLYWCTLTFDSENDIKQKCTKLKMAWRLFEKFCDLVLMVEEYGELYGRYHLHAFITFKKGARLEDFYKSWSSRITAKIIYSNAFMVAKIKYLTKYSTKDVPRLRRNKKLIELIKLEKKIKLKERYGFGSLAVPLRHEAYRLCDNLENELPF